MDNQDGRVPDGTGLSSQATEPASSLGPSGFDPSRGDKPRRRIVAKIEIEADDWTSVRRVLRQLDTRIAVRDGLGNVISGGYDSGYAVTSDEDDAITHDIWAARLDCYLDYIDDRDSDGSPKGGDADAAPFTTARAEGIAQSKSTTTDPESAG